MSGKLSHYEPHERERITQIMAALVEADIAAGRLELTDEAIKAAMPQAMREAVAIYNAAVEYVS